MTAVSLRWSRGATAGTDPLLHARGKQLLHAHAADSLRRLQASHYPAYAHRDENTPKNMAKILIKLLSTKGSSPALLLDSFSVPVDYTKEQLYWITLLVHLASHPT